jgi:hypothetical protein
MSRGTKVAVVENDEKVAEVVEKVEKVEVEKVQHTRFEYKGLLSELSKPVAERQPIVVGRGGVMKQARTYALDTHDAEKMRKVFKDTGVFQNPYRTSGVYGALFQACINLGVNKRHPIKAVMHEAKSILSKFETEGGSNAWKDFADRKPVNPKTAKDVDGRFYQNACVLQRLSGAHPYGEKMRQLLACLDILGEKGSPELMLHTGFSNYNAVVPVNELVRVRGVKKAKVVKEKVAKVKVVKVKVAKGKSPAKKSEKKVKKPVSKPKAQEVEHVEAPVEAPAVAAETVEMVQS